MASAVMHVAAQYLYGFDLCYINYIRFSCDLLDLHAMVMIYKTLTLTL